MDKMMLCRQMVVASSFNCLQRRVALEYGTFVELDAYFTKIEAKLKKCDLSLENFHGMEACDIYTLKLSKPKKLGNVFRLKSDFCNDLPSLEEN